MNMQINYEPYFLKESMNFPSIIYTEKNMTSVAYVISFSSNIIVNIYLMSQSFCNAKFFVVK